MRENWIQLSAEQIAEFLPILRKFEEDEKLTISEITEEAGSNVGDNYIGVLIRMRVTGKRGDGTPYRRNFMSKVYPAHRAISDAFRVDLLFRNEAHVYKNILPEMGPIAPRCVYANDRKIIMEDLKEKGYTVCDRLQFVDLEHCIYIVQALASIHATSLSMKLRDPVFFEKLVEPLADTLFSDHHNPIFRTAIENSLLKSLECLQLIETKTPEVEEAIELLDRYRKEAYDIVVDQINSPKEKYFLLCHGDPWTNNMMFMHGPKGEIIDMKFIDFQICRHNALALDFHYFVYACAKVSVLDEHYDLLVEKYYEKFMECLKAKDVSQEDLDQLTVPWLQSQLKKYAVYGLICSMMLIHTIMASGDDIVDMDKIAAEDLNVENMKKIHIPVTLEKSKRVLAICSHYKRKYC